MVSDENQIYETKVIPSEVRSVAMTPIIEPVASVAQPKLTSHKDFRWVCGKFHAQDGLIPVDKKIVFGHEVCARLHGVDKFTPWFGKQLIGIDGGIKS
jgi:hypothetical protein